MQQVLYKEKKMSYDIKESYEFVDFLDNEYAVKVTKGKYENVLYKYNKVSFQEDDDGNETATISFDVTVLDGIVEPKNEEFDKLCGDILVDILRNALESGEYEIGGNTDTDSEKSTSE